MFSVGFSELLLILIIAYVFVGPQDLPKVTRWLARALKRIRQLISEAKKEINWEQLVNETEGVKEEIKNTANENDRDIQKGLSEVHGEISKVKREFEKNIN